MEIKDRKNSPSWTPRRVQNITMHSFDPEYFNVITQL